MNILQDSPAKVKTFTPSTELTGYVRCCGCYCWTDDYQVRQAACGTGYALCRLCQLRYERFNWRREQIDQRIESYTGGDMAVYA